MEKILIIYNDSSGKNTGEAIAIELKRYIESEQPTWAIKCHVSNSDVSQQLLQREAEEFQATRLVFIGGDGTIHHLVKTFKETIHKYVIGIIPGGTVNNFARSLNLPLNYEESFQHIVYGEIREVDFGVINGEDVIISTLTIGILADTAARVSQQEKQKFGPLAFAKRFLKLWVQKKRYPLTIHANGEEWTGKMALLTITMTNSAGGYIYFDPNASPDDGNMHVTILKKLSLRQTFKLLPQIIIGNLENIQDVIYFSSGSIRIESTDSKVKTRTDGDPTSNLPVQLEVKHKGMRVLTPNKSSNL